MHWIFVQRISHTLAMGKNRDYTGLVRTPPSMAWLIRERSIVKGQLDRCQRKLSELPREIVELEQALASLDAVIPRHEVKVNPKAIKGRHPKAPAIFPYGAVTKHILKCLREANGKPIYTTEIAFSLARLHGVSLDGKARAEVMDSVKKRLQELGCKRIVKAHHDKQTTSPGRWSLVDDDELLEVKAA